MKRVDILREQAVVLRRLVDSFDSPQIKEELLFLADRCDRLAGNMAHQISDRLTQPISGNPLSLRPRLPKHTVEPRR
jgi:hypothetical protein